jgi:hypothetical protein
MAAIGVVGVKKRCCKGNPRGKRCPVAPKRVALAGLAGRLDERTYLVHASKKPSRPRG